MFQHQSLPLQEHAQHQLLTIKAFDSPGAQQQHAPFQHKSVMMHSPVSIRTREFMSTAYSVCSKMKQDQLTLDPQAGADVDAI